MIIGLSGYQRTGKDTVAGILARGHGFEILSFATRLRQLASDTNPDWRGLVQQFGYEEAKDRFPEVRKYLQVLGVAVREALGDDAWIRPVLQQAGRGDASVISDVRFPNEAEAIRSAGGIVVRIDRPGHGPKGDHVSEWVTQDPHFVIDNSDTLDDLVRMIGIFMDTVKSWRNG